MYFFSFILPHSTIKQEIPVYYTLFQFAPFHFLNYSFILLCFKLTKYYHSLVTQLCRYVFTADPRGTLKLWSLADPSQSDLQSSMGSNKALRIAEFIPNYGMRIMCLDACMKEEVFIYPWIGILSSLLWSCYEERKAQNNYNMTHPYLCRIH